MIGFICFTVSSPKKYNIKGVLTRQNWKITYRTLILRMDQKGCGGEKMVERVLMITPEFEGVAKAGGLAAAVTGLSAELKRKGVDVRVIMPNISYGYGRRKFVNSEIESKEQVEIEGIPVHFAKSVRIAGTYHSTNLDIGDIVYRKESRDAYIAALTLGHTAPEILRSMMDTWVPDVIHCHEWFTAAVIPNFQQGVFRKIPKILTSHNMKYIGEVPNSSYDLSSSAQRWNETFTIPTHQHALVLYNELFGSLLEMGIHTADEFTTVSEKYAAEVMENQIPVDSRVRERAIAKGVVGIINGIDYDKMNPTQAKVPFDASDPESLSYGKGANKYALQQHFGFSPDANKMQVTVMSRLVDEKGSYELLDALDQLMALDIQLLIVGEPDGVLRNRLYHERGVYSDPKIVGANTMISPKFTTEEERKLILAGSDAILMPSKTEPCGLVQLEGMAYGAIPICTLTGGLADTVKVFTGSDGYGVPVQEVTVEGIVQAVKNAVALYQNKEQFRVAQMSAARQRFTWNNPVDRYLARYDNLV